MASEDNDILVPFCTSPRHYPPSEVIRRLPDDIHSWMCPDCGEITKLEKPT